jgi:hypothetical protein
MAIHEGKWKCTYCGGVNLGRDVKCAQCGQPRGKDVKFFMDADSAEVADQNLLNLAASGADWTCSFCSTNNRGKETRCRQCGAERGASRSLQEKLVTEQGSTPLGAAAPSPAMPAAAAGRARARPLLWGGIAAGVVALGALAYFLFFATSEKTAVLERGTWTRSVPVEEYRWVEHTDWQDSVPPRAVILQQWQDKYGTEQVQVGTERRKTGQVDKGNGFFEDVYEDVPVYESRDVYKTRTRYRIQEWVETRRLKSEGDLSTPPAWPAVSLGAMEREGTRAESATLYLKLGDKTYQYAVPVSSLGAYRAGGRYKIWITTLGAVKKIEAE